MVKLLDYMRYYKLDSNDVLDIISKYERLQETTKEQEKRIESMIYMYEGAVASGRKSGNEVTNIKKKLKKQKNKYNKKMLSMTVEILHLKSQLYDLRQGNIVKMEDYRKIQ